jgi:hypothetical protein
MNQVIIDKKKYVIITKKEYEGLRKQAVMKRKPDKILSLEEARAYTKKLIRKRAEEG